jgi:hypothetical protein
MTVVAAARSLVAADIGFGSMLLLMAALLALPACAASRAHRGKSTLESFLLFFFSISTKSLPDSDIPFRTLALGLRLFNKKWR